MDTTKEYKLIEGTFELSEAQEIALSLIDYKIRYHANKIFSHEERFGIKDENSVTRIAELKETYKALFERFSRMKGKDVKMKINSTISIDEEG